jgi:hypothetical protein
LADKNGGPEVSRRGDYTIVYNGKTVKVIDSNGEVVWEGHATSGKGKHMNNPASQDVQNEGPIPEGKYSFSGKSWNHVSPARQLYKIFTRQGDWGYYNAKLTPHTYHGNRHSFYIHGGSYPGSAGCIDVGSGVTQVRNLTVNQTNVNVIVKYGK